MGENEGVIIQISHEVKKTLMDAEAGHDWLHVERVWHNALLILDDETSADRTTVQLAALLHDIADSKFHHGDETVGPRKARELMTAFGIESSIIDVTILIIENMSYKGGFAHSSYQSLELDIVRDADRLDAIGAIGVARAFTYGGYKNRRFYDHQWMPEIFDSREAYKKVQGPTINHFYEKLLKLKDLMKTKKAKEIAKKRHEFLELFLDNFMEETGWRIS